MAGFMKYLKQGYKKVYSLLIIIGCKDTEINSAPNVVIRNNISHQQNQGDLFCHVSLKYDTGNGHLMIA